MSNYWITKILKGLAIFIAVALFFSFIVMQLWNWLVPDIFGGGVINIYQAFGLLLLSKILLSGFPGGPHKCRRKGGPQWKDRLRKKLEKMTPEERKRFKERFHSKCSRGFYHEQEGEN